MKCAVCFSKSQKDPQTITSLMVEALRLYPHQSTESLKLGEDGCLGVVRTFNNKQSKIPFLYTEKGNILAISGAPIDMQGSIQEKFQTILKGDYRQAAQLFKTMDGAFVCFFWDQQNRKLVFATDFLGFKPMYLLCTDENFILASELKAISASGLIDIKMNPAGWGAFISLGAHVGNKTSLMGVKRLDSASVYTFDPKTFDLKQESYWKWPQLESDWTWEKFDHNRFIEAIKTNIKQYMEYGYLGTLLLSGGYDSRFIAALLNELKVSPKTLIVNHPDEHNNADGNIAVQIAKKLGLSYEVKSSSPDFYSTRRYMDYLINNEVATPSLYLFVTNLSSFIIEQNPAVWEGVTLGYILTGSHYGTENFHEYFKHNLKSLDSDRWKAAGKVFSSKMIDEMYGSFKELLDREVAKYPDNCAGVNAYAILNWSRNRTALNPCQVYSNHTLCMFPGMCRDFMNMVGGIPYEMKRDGKLYDNIFNQYFPEIAKIPVCSGGKFYMPSKKMSHQLQLSMIKASSHVQSHQWTQGLLRLIKKTSYEWDQSSLVDRVIERVDWGHPDLNNDGMQNYKQWSKYSYEKALLFYWQIWRWIMEGKISDIKKELFKD